MLNTELHRLSVRPKRMRSWCIQLPGRGGFALEEERWVLEKWHELVMSDAEKDIAIHSQNHSHGGLDNSIQKINLLIRVQFALSNYQLCRLRSRSDFHSKYVSSDHKAKTGFAVGFIAVPIKVQVHCDPFSPTNGSRCRGYR